MVTFLHTHRHFIASQVRRELTGRFAGTSLGVLWTVLLPLMQAVLYTLVFSVIMRARPGGEYQKIPFAVWLLAGLMPWSLFAESLSTAARSITGNAYMVKKTMFDKRVLPLSCVLSAAITHGVSLVVLLVIMLAFGVTPHWGILLTPLFAALLAVFALGWAYILAALNVFFRDVDQILGVVLQLAFFATPIVYPEEFLPEGLRFLALANPMHHIVTFYRQAIFLGAAPDPAWLLAVAAGVALFCWLGDALFRSLAPEFADLL